MEFLTAVTNAKKNCPTQSQFIQSLLADYTSFLQSDEFNHTIQSMDTFIELILSSNFDKLQKV